MAVYGRARGASNNGTPTIRRATAIARSSSLANAKAAIPTVESRLADVSEPIPKQGIYQPCSSARWGNRLEAESTRGRWRRLRKKGSIRGRMQHGRHLEECLRVRPRRGRFPAWTAASGSGTRSGSPVRPRPVRKARPAGVMFWLGIQSTPAAAPLDSSRALGRVGVWA